MTVSDSRPVRANERCTAPWAGHAGACRAWSAPGRVIHRTGDHLQATPATSPADDQIAQPGAGRIHIVNAGHGEEHLAGNVTGKSKSALTPAPARANRRRRA